MFQFKIERVEFLPVAKIWCLTGKIICGEIQNNSDAFIETNSGLNRIKIETIAFVDPPSINGQKRMTLTARENDKISNDLVGKVLTSRSRSLITA